MFYVRKRDCLFWKPWLNLLCSQYAIGNDSNRQLSSKYVTDSKHSYVARVMDKMPYYLLQSNERTIIYIIFIIIYWRFFAVVIVVAIVRTFVCSFVLYMCSFLSCVKEGVSALVMHKHTDRPLPDGIKCAIQIKLKQHTTAATPHKTLERRQFNNKNWSKNKSIGYFNLCVRVSFNFVVAFLSHVHRFSWQLSFSFFHVILRLGLFQSFFF